MEKVLAEIWVVEYKDGKLVENRGNEASSIAEARKFTSQAAAAAAAAFLNEGLHEDHLGRVVPKRVF